MRRLLLTAAAAAAVFVPSAVQAQVSFGATAAWHDDFDFGIGAVLEAPVPSIHPNVAILGEFLYFFPGDEFGDDFNYIEINPGLKWNFSLADNPDLTPFALGGLNIARASNGTSETEVGLNLGGGVTFGSGSLRPSVGGRFELSGGEGFVLFGSIMLGGG